MVRFISQIKKSIYRVDQSSITMHHIDIEKLNSKIDKMSKEQHMDIFILLRKHGKLTINENKNGFFANLSFFPEDVLQELLFYVDRKMDATID
jgi:hypothetical protein